MRNIAGALALLGLLACVPENDPVTVSEAGDLTQRATWSASLTALPTFTVSGTTAIADFGPYFDLQLDIANAAPSTAYSWRIFPGTCAAPGATQFGPVQAYPNLTSNAAGVVQVKRTLSGPLNLSATYNIRVSTVATPVRIVACGDLKH
jgi:hypothetical protein